MSDFITVVTGLPRSGTTMMMRMLEAGGIEPYYDTSRPLSWAENGQDFINYNIILRETNEINDLVNGNGDWLKNCYGQAVKVLTPSKVIVPKGHPYRFIYMDRKPKQIFKSLNKYCDRADLSPGPGRFFPTIQSLRVARSASIALLKTYPDSRVMVLRFEEVLKKPLACAIRVSHFLGQVLDIVAMAHVVVKRPAHSLPYMLEDRIYT